MFSTELYAARVGWVALTVFKQWNLARPIMMYQVGEHGWGSDCVGIEVGDILLLGAMHFLKTWQYFENSKF